MQSSLFGNHQQPEVQQFSEAGFYLPHFADARATEVIDVIRDCVRQSPLRHFTTPGGGKMSVLSSSCGDYGWMSDRKGYRYESIDPVTEAPWPQMPPVVKRYAQQAAKLCGFNDFDPDACLINVYKAGSKMGLHQDKDESDFAQPIVSFSFGLPAIFLWGGLKRTEKPSQIAIQHGDVLVWGGPDRLRYHGIKTLAKGHHPATGDVRINLTLRKR